MEDSKIEARKKYKQAHYRKNREKYLQRVKLYAQNNPDKIATYKKEWRARNKERVQEKQRQHYLANKELYKERAKQLRKAYPDRDAEHRIRRRAKKAQATVNDFTRAQWQELQDFYDHRCAYCRKKCHTLTQDHITPLSHDGLHTLHNIVPSCRSCNSQKATKAPLSPVQPLLLTVAPSRAWRNRRTDGRN